MRVCVVTPPQPFMSLFVDIGFTSRLTLVTFEELRQPNPTLLFLPLVLVEEVLGNVAGETAISDNN